MWKQKNVLQVYEQKSFGNRKKKILHRPLLVIKFIIKQHENKELGETNPVKKMDRVMRNYFNLSV